MKIQFALAVLALAAGLAAAPVSKPRPKPEVAAQASAEEWLAVVDQGNYKESWKMMAATFKETVSRRRWNSTVQDLRAPLGKTLSRKLKSAELTKDLAGAPDGEYVVLKFDTDFENKSNVVETVTPMRESDLQWRVSGYSLK